MISSFENAASQGSTLSFLGRPSFIVSVSIVNLAASSENVFGHMRRPRSACATAQSDQSLYCLLAESLDTLDV